MCGNLECIYRTIHIIITVPPPSLTCAWLALTPVIPVCGLYLWWNSPTMFVPLLLAYETGADIWSDCNEDTWTINTCNMHASGYRVD